MTDFRNPLPTVDCVIFMPSGSFVLVRRKKAPLGWALPGGFVNAGESLSQAAVREAKEETGLNVKLIEQFHTYSNPSRDPRKHIMSTVFIGGSSGVPVGADDAAEARIVTWDTLGAFDLAFDHAQILADVLAYRRDGTRPPAER